MRLAPGVFAALTGIAVRDSKGNLVAKHFQRLTPDVGHPALKEHLHAVIALMKVSRNKRQFLSLVNRAFPRQDQTLMLPLEFKDDEEEG